VNAIGANPIVLLTGTKGKLLKAFKEEKAKERFSTPGSAHSRRPAEAPQEANRWVTELAMSLPESKST